MINLIFIGVLGFFVFLLPHLGFPYSWQSNMYTIFGLVIMALAYRESIQSPQEESEHEEEHERAYVDSEPTEERRHSARVNNVGNNAEGF